MFKREHEAQKINEQKIEDMSSIANEIDARRKRRERARREAVLCI